MPLLTLPEARALLKISGSASDAELLDDVAAADEIVAYFCGPVSATTVTETRRAWGAIALTTTPVISLTSVTGDVYGVQPLTGLRVNCSSGVIRAKAYSLPIREDDWTVVYQAGRTTVDVLLKQAARIILKHQWQSRLGSGRRSSGDGDTTMIPELGYAIPNRALELMKPRMTGPSVG